MLSSIQFRLSGISVKNFFKEKGRPVLINAKIGPAIPPILQEKTYHQSAWALNKLTLRERACSLGYKSPGSTLCPGSDSPWERISQDLITFVLPVVDGVSVDSETPVVTSSISRICWYSLRRCS
jgi:hypothetical protein